MKSTFCLVVSALLLSACTKKSPPRRWPEPCETNKVIPITDPDMLACRFKAGTYWVFTDSLRPGQLDSCGINEFTESTAQSGRRSPCLLAEQHHGIIHDLTVPEIHNILTVRPDSCLMYDQIGLRSIFQPRSVNKRHQFFDSLEVNGRYYKNVMRSEMIYFQKQGLLTIPPRSSMISYFCLSSGFVRLDVYQDGNFIYGKRLLRSQIVR